MTYTFYLSESMPPKIDEKTLVLLNHLLGESNPITHPVQPQTDLRENIFRLDLPAAPGAEYFLDFGFMKVGSGK
jgi:hypothetical protein